MNSTLQTMKESWHTKLGFRLVSVPYTEAEYQERIHFVRANEFHRRSGRMFEDHIRHGIGFWTLLIVGIAVSRLTSKTIALFQHQHRRSCQMAYLME